MCPADELSPSGVDCGLAIYIDRQLAGHVQQGDGAVSRGVLFDTASRNPGLKLPLTPEQFCKAGIAAVDAACLRDRGAPCPALKVAEADTVLVDISRGTRHRRAPLRSPFVVQRYRGPLFVEACFADPMYGGNRSAAVFWKMIGYPGLPANHAIDMVRYRGKPYPGAGSPKSIGDFLVTPDRVLGLTVAKRLPRRTVVVVGGGLCAGLLSRQLTAQGIDVLVLERGVDHGGGAEARLPSQPRRTALGTATRQEHAELATRNLHVAALAARRVAAGALDGSLSAGPGRGRRRQPLERKVTWRMVGIRSRVAHAP